MKKRPTVTFSPFPVNLREAILQGLVVYREKGYGNELGEVECIHMCIKDFLAQHFSVYAGKPELTPDILQLFERVTEGD